ncbi:uncharacterized protein [Physcomitrium patens]|uniref:uncharacterized protein n=1 Tax=Physcomitrium patens TaxID=3218 RepID=UPI003CCCD01A
MRLVESSFQDPAYCSCNCSYLPVDLETKSTSQEKKKKRGQGRGEIGRYWSHFFRNFTANTIDHDEGKKTIYEIRKQDQTPKPVGVTFCKLCSPNLKEKHSRVPMKLWDQS